MKRRALAAAVVSLLLLVLGAIVGRATAPAKIVEVKREASGEISAQAKKTEDASARTLALDTRHVASLHKRSVRRPDGTVVRDVAVVMEAETHGTKQEAQEHREAEIRYVDRWHTKEEIKIVEAARPQWRAGVFGGATLGLRPTYGGILERRVAGPIIAGAWATSEPAAGLMIGIEW